VAVALETWRPWNLSARLHRIVPERKVAAVRAAAVICAPSLQRCVAPGSKLSAMRRFSRTALPELLGVAPARFHDTRIHRVLGRLDGIAPATPNNHTCSNGCASPIEAEIGARIAPRSAT